MNDIVEWIKEHEPIDYSGGQLMYFVPCTDEFITDKYGYCEKLETIVGDSFIDCVLKAMGRETINKEFDTLITEVEDE